MKIAYESWRPTGSTRTMIVHATRIIDKYVEMGYTLTLRQLFYQFVRENLFANTEKNYRCLGTVLKRARLAGIVDWEAIEDRTRGSIQRSRWENKGDILATVPPAYHKDLWRGQGLRPEVLIEKDALVGVLSGVCHRHDVPLLSCRGYLSASEAWRAGQRMTWHRNNERQGQTQVVLYLGDHDPSGMDMSDDLKSRITQFYVKHTGREPVFRRLALNMDQIRELDPPPNPTKPKDSRSPKYVRRFGRECWELDALEPDYMERLVQDEVVDMIDHDVLAARWEEIERERGELKEAMDDLAEALARGERPTYDEAMVGDSSEEAVMQRYLEENGIEGPDAEEVMRLGLKRFIL